MHDQLLRDRERRGQTINEWIQNTNKPLISVHANIPGSNKNIPEAYIIVRFFEYKVSQQWSVTKRMRFDSSDGPYVLLVIEDEDLTKVKEQLISFESSTYGRLIDLDLWSKDYVQITRKMLNAPDRICYLCGDLAHRCVRSKMHPLEDILRYVLDTTQAHLRENLSYLMKQAMMDELNLEYKFGLVTPTSQGSHPDMNYSMMQRAQDAIIHYFILLFELGYQSDSTLSLFKKARMIGLQAEKAMLKATDGINCYKGLIFILGLLLVSLGYTLKNKLPMTSLFKNIQDLSKSIYDDFKESPTTFGEIAYQNYHISGARGEAYLGMPSVQKAFELIKDEPITDQLLRKTLKQLILTTDDTVLLKRAGSIENYQMIKEKIKALDVENDEDVIAFTNEAIQLNLSFGGSADLLVTTLFLRNIAKNYF